MIETQFPLITADAVITLFVEGFNAAKQGVWTMPYIRQVFSNKKTKNYASIGNNPLPQEYTDEIRIGQLFEKSFSITSLKYASALKIDLADFQEDDTGGLMDRVRDLGDTAQRLPNSLVADLINLGDVQVAYDGNNFYDTTHQEALSGVQSNKITSPAVIPAAPTLAEFETGWILAMTTLMGLLDDQGEPMNEEIVLTQAENVNIWTLVPSNMAGIALKFLKPDQVLINNTTNAFRGTGQLRSITRLTKTDTFYLFNLDHAVNKPFIMQSKNDMVVQTSGLANLGRGLQSGEVPLGTLMHDNAWIAAKRWMAIAYGMWQKTISCQFT